MNNSWTGLVFPSTAPKEIRITAQGNSALSFTIIVKLEESLHQDGQLDGKCSRQKVEDHSTETVTSKKGQQESQNL